MLFARDHVKVHILPNVMKVEIVFEWFYAPFNIYMWITIEIIRGIICVVMPKKKPNQNCNGTSHIALLLEKHIEM